TTCLSDGCASRTPRFHPARAAPCYPFLLLMRRRAPRPTLFPYTTLFRSDAGGAGGAERRPTLAFTRSGLVVDRGDLAYHLKRERSEEHTSELQSRGHLVCRLLLEKKNSEVLGAVAETEDNGKRAVVLRVR